MHDHGAGDAPQGPQCPKLPVTQSLHQALESEFPTSDASPGFARAGSQLIHSSSPGSDSHSVDGYDAQCLGNDWNWSAYYFPTAHPAAEQSAVAEVWIGAGAAAGEAAKEQAAAVETTVASAAYPRKRSHAGEPCRSWQGSSIQVRASWRSWHCSCGGHRPDRGTKQTTRPKPPTKTSVC